MHIETTTNYTHNREVNICKSHKKFSRPKHRTRDLCVADQHCKHSATQGFGKRTNIWTHCNFETEDMTEKSVWSRRGTSLVIDQEAETWRERARAQLNTSARVPSARYVRNRGHRVTRCQRAPCCSASSTLVCNALTLEDLLGHDLLGLGIHDFLL